MDENAEMEDQILIDFQGREIRFTRERHQHIVHFHPEMTGQMTRIQEILQQPEKVIQSKMDEAVELFYHFYQDTSVGEKYLCIVVKVIQNDAFIITAYLTDTIKKGKEIWSK